MDDRYALGNFIDSYNRCVDVFGDENINKLNIHSFTDEVLQPDISKAYRTVDRLYNGTDALCLSVEISSGTLCGLCLCVCYDDEFYDSGNNFNIAMNIYCVAIAAFADVSIDEAKLYIDAIFANGNENDVFEYCKNGCTYIWDNSLRDTDLYKIKSESK